MEASRAIKIWAQGCKEPPILNTKDIRSKNLMRLNMI
jgi:hypothetical protein